MGPIFGAFHFLKAEEEASSTLVLRRNQNDKNHAVHVANVRHFEFSWKRRERRILAREWMSHRVFDLRFRALNPQPTCSRSREIASDHSRSHLITSHTLWTALGQGMVPFPEVSQPEKNWRGRLKVAVGHSFALEAGRTAFANFRPFFASFHWRPVEKALCRAKNRRGQQLRQ